jgi:hypothetical protein
MSIGMTGFEPATSWSQTRRSSQAELHPEQSGGQSRGDVANRQRGHDLHDCGGVRFDHGEALRDSQLFPFCRTSLEIVNRLCRAMQLADDPFKVVIGLEVNDDLASILPRQFDFDRRPQTITQLVPQAEDVRRELDDRGL